MDVSESIYRWTDHSFFAIPFLRDAYSDTISCLIGLIDTLSAQDLPGEIVLCWDQDELAEIATQLGVSDPEPYPDHT